MTVAGLVAAMKELERQKEELELEVARHHTDFLHIQHILEDIEEKRVTKKKGLRAIRNVVG